MSPVRCLCDEGDVMGDDHVLYKRMINMCMFIGGSFLPVRVGAEQIVTI